jgi:DNA modification methylase
MIILQLEGECMTVKMIKYLGKLRTPESFSQLLDLFETETKLEIRREIISSIGRYTDKEMVYIFMAEHAFSVKNMELVYQVYRTCLYNIDDPKFEALANKIEKHYENEMIQLMKKYFQKKKRSTKESSVNHINEYKNPLLLEGDSEEMLESLSDGSVHLVFTSPPYYNAREYNNFHSFQDYINKMKKIFGKIYRVLENGRYVIVNVSPINSGRPGREFASKRYPIHFEFHNILKESGYTFIDEIYWVKQEASVPRRIGAYLNLRKPLTYKPNNITENILVYRKDVGNLIDENLKHYDNGKVNLDDDSNSLLTSNCWYISPVSSRKHPAVFPEKLCENILKFYSFKGDTILDPFAGSGTIAKVSLKMGRIPILIEKNKKYTSIINKIISEFERGKNEYE